MSGVICHGPAVGSLACMASFLGPSLGVDMIQAALKALPLVTQYMVKFG